MPTITLPEMDLTKVRIPEVDLSKVDLPKVDLSKLELPKAVEGHVKTVTDWADGLELPKAGREERSNGLPFLPIAAFVAVIAAIAAAFWLVTSPTAATRVRDSADRTWRKVTRQTTDMVRYDAEDDLASLLPSQDVDATDSVDAGKAGMSLGDEPTGI
jgi:hypothetical protein